MNWYTPDIDELIRQAIEQVHVDLKKVDTTSADFLHKWMVELVKGDHPSAYFKHPFAVPFLLLPYWLEQSLRGEVDEDFQRDLIASSINAYYHIRVIDDVMDGDRGDAITMLALSSVFHMQFQMPYQRYFPPDHAFWDAFREIWLQQAAVTLADDLPEAIDEQRFLNVISQKICGIKIPVAAVCYHYDRLDVLDNWLKVIDLYSVWHQFFQDMIGWHKDIKHESRTYFLEEAERQRKPDESVAAWITREGIDWGVAQLNGWMATIQQTAAACNSPTLIQYMEDREQMLQEQRRKMDAGLKLMAQLSRLEPKS